MAARVTTPRGRLSAGSPPRKLSSLMFWLEGRMARVLFQFCRDWTTSETSTWRMESARAVTIRWLLPFHKTWHSTAWTLPRKKISLMSKYLRMKCLKRSLTGNRYGPAFLSRACAAYVQTCSISRLRTSLRQPSMHSQRRKELRSRTTPYGCWESGYSSCQLSRY